MQKYLNLDSNFDPFKGGVHNLSFDVSTFKGGEEHFRLLYEEVAVANNLSQDDSVMITTRAINSSSVMRILIANDALKRLGIKDISLSIMYLPYARQDRVMVMGEALSIKVFADLINNCNFSVVQILDPHSDVGPALINNCVILSDAYISYIRKAYYEITLLGNDKICAVSPDAGAYKKIFKTTSALTFSGDIILCTKVRDLKTNNLSSEINIIGDVKDKACIIIDDICDGGRTFAELGKQLKEKGAAKVYLIITHGIFSYGEEPLKPHIDHVWTTNSFKDYKSDFVTLINILN